MTASYEAAAGAGVHRLAIPTPFAVGRVNAYLIEDEPLTLVDSGPNSGLSLDELERGLSALGRSIEDIELVLLTHQHIDHIGLAGIVVARSGAEVAAIDAAVPYVQDYSRAADLQDEFAAATMLRHGLPEEVVQALRSVSRAFRGWGAACAISRVLHDGDTVQLRDRRFEVLFRPGHSPSDTVFHDTERRMLIAGDHLLAEVSSNPLLSPAPGQIERGAEAERGRSLVNYLESLGLTRAMDLEVVLGGHGDPVGDHRALIDERFELHRRRAEKIAALIAERPRTGHELAQAIWGDIAVTQAFLTLSEVVGHVDLLIADGRVAEDEADGVIRFAPAGG